MESDSDFLMDALLLHAMPQERAANLLPYLVPVPVACPSCDEDWVLMMNRDIALEVQQGRAGKSHLELLLAEIMSSCTSGHTPLHLRTDGRRVWRFGDAA